MTFRPQLLCGYEELVNQYVLPVLSAPQVPYLVFDTPVHNTVLELLNQIDRLYDTKPVGYELSALSCFFALQAELYQYVVQHTDALAAGTAACGYSSPSYFAERFLTAKGCTPTQYRRS